MLDAVVIEILSTSPKLPHCPKKRTPQLCVTARSSPSQDTRYPSNSPYGGSWGARGLPGARSPSRLCPMSARNSLPGQPSSPSSEVWCFCCQPRLFAAQAGAGTAPQPPWPRCFPEGPDPGDSHPAQTVPFREERWLRLGVMGGGGKREGDPPLPATARIVCPAPDRASGSFINAKIKPCQATPSKARPRTRCSL